MPAKKSVAFQEHFADGYMAVGFERLPDESRYVLKPSAGTDYGN